LRQPIIIGVGGFSSNVGKTTLMCQLLRAFPGWEAIKTTRGHYRSCGKDSEACCVSHLLGEEPLIRSGRAETYEAGKDTGRYWDAGASNVHWLIATENQVDKGIHKALEGVRAQGVFVEGNSFSQFIQTDYFVMVRRSGLSTIKGSAKACMARVSSVFIFDNDDNQAKDILVKEVNNDCPVFSQPSFHMLISHLRSAIAERSLN